MHSPEVFIDGESVRIEGPIPATVGELLAWVEQTLDSLGRVMAGACVDGIQFTEGTGSMPVGEASRIEVSSLSVQDAVARLADATAAALAEVREVADELSSVVLRSPWKDVGDRCAQVARRLGSALESASQVVAHTGEQSTTGVAVHEVLRFVDRWIDAVKAADAAEVCVRLQRELLPALDGAIEALRRSGEGGS